MVHLISVDMPAFAPLTSKAASFGVHMDRVRDVTFGDFFMNSPTDLKVLNQIISPTGQPAAVCQPPEDLYTVFSMLMKSRLISRRKQRALMGFNSLESWLV